MAPTARPRVLFVTYEASRTGSPLLLLRFLRWLREQDAVEAEVLCWRGGPLVDDLRRVAPTRVLAPGERATMRSDSNVYSAVRGEDGMSESSGVFWLLPYWMARYYGYIGAPR